MFCSVPEKLPPLTVKVGVPPATVSIVPLPVRLDTLALNWFKSSVPLTVAAVPAGRAVLEPSCKRPALIFVGPV